MPLLIKHPIRKFFGVVALLLLLIVYSLVLMVFASSTLPSVGGLGAFVFYAVAGLAWVPIAILILRWAFAP
jgi:hypothetical protein